MATYQNASEAVIVLTDLFDERVRKTQGKSNELSILPGEQITVDDTVAELSNDIATFLSAGKLTIVTPPSRGVVNTGNGSQNGIILSQSDGSKRIIYFENGEYTDDEYTG